MDFLKELAKPFPKEAYDKLTFGAKLTTIKAYYVIERLNTVFGPMGTGWGAKELRFTREGKEGCCVGVFWYNSKTLKNAQFPAVGHGKGDEAEKKALTNMICKAASYLHCGLDVYKGQHTDDAYERSPVSNENTLMDDKGDVRAFLSKNAAVDLKNEWVTLVFEELLIPPVDQEKVFLGLIKAKNFSQISLDTGAKLAQAMIDQKDAIIKKSKKIWKS